ncbi:sulfite reductase [NADPH] flavoprotein alpha-component [Paenibacillus sp. FSL R7-0273]|uniref:assimilatory sulfite reductase (NADPH) flavoprotein subunit n=1 Tax=Paenibacillus sp. FSL R7-0273 TaxID=1536772 RepID=UPI0004F8D11B|nr:assimilatory sulfite reductase (NADPH) flavoprotein subunit [Paenibacillus sp. FSL R7-0273]AIQ48044.1 sulfite reductase [NADPH] flavoprotein alpha-component [Paenibacillus sp. FSL R7-0273]OMF84720.1 sulfite reductase [NADPH] flavoprotein, alpha-component [Paenibacillus sp. FSL R7-0273]
MQLQVTNSPFNESQVQLLNQLLPTLTESQQIWLGGYLSAMSLRGAGAAAAAGEQPALVQAAPSAVPAAAPPVSREVTVLFGSQTGNCQRLATSLSRKLEEQGFQVSVSAMNAFKPNTLKKVENLLILVSTHGEGEPPDNARAFHEFLYSKRAPQLEALRYSVLGLGDTSYEFFCQTGKDFDQRLEELGGTRLSPRIDCDLDYDEPVADWFAKVLEALNGPQNAPQLADAAVQAAEKADEPQSPYSRNLPFQAEVLENLNLNGRGSDRETRHLELSLAGSGLTFEPGDSLGVYPENHPQLVADIIAAAGWNADETVPLNKKGDEGTLREALLRHYEITVLTKPLLEQAAKLSAAPGLQALLAPEAQQELKSYIQGRDLLDLINDFGPWNAAASSFVTILRKLPARLYSISSSYNANPEEVHFTVRAVRYETHGRERYGVCSVHCAERVQPGDTLPVYIQSNPNFKLPVNPDVPVIMIGPGTGVAPFRSFLEERGEQGAGGKTWLFYGDRHFVTDFLYQTDWQRMLKEGVLNKLDVAFSRDTEEKVYVQHRILEHSKELYAWLQEGAHVYVCGDEKHMAHDVHTALVTVIQEEAGLSPEAAAAYLENLQQEQRYQRDVY